MMVPETPSDTGSFQNGLFFDAEKENES